MPIKAPGGKDELRFWAILGDTYNSVDLQRPSVPEIGPVRARPLGPASGAEGSGLGPSAGSRRLRGQELTVCPRLPVLTAGPRRSARSSPLDFPRSLPSALFCARSTSSPRRSPG